VSARPSAAHRADTIVEIKATFEELHARELWHEKWPALAGHLGWLIAEVDRSHAEIGHLRGLLAQLQWLGTHCEGGREYPACPVCGVLADSPAVGQQPHAEGCRLAAALGR
jgi:hypothetical protein